MRAGKSAFSPNRMEFSPIHKYMESTSPLGIHAHLGGVYRFAAFIECFQTFFHVVDTLTVHRLHVCFDECAVAFNQLWRIISPLSGDSVELLRGRQSNFAQIHAYVPLLIVCLLFNMCVCFLAEKIAGFKENFPRHLEIRFRKFDQKRFPMVFRPLKIPFMQK